MPDRRRPGFALATLFAINLMNFFDRQLLGAVGELIRTTWGLSDTALGTLGTAFTIVYAIVGLPLGRLADVASRTRLLAGGVFAWSLLTAASGMCSTFAQLFIVRLGVGLGEATCAPAASSLIGDLFPAHRRARALSVFMLGLPLGIAASFLLGGYVAKHFGWQQAFFLAALPGFACAAAALRVGEPPRGATEDHAVGGARREGSAVRLVLSIPSMWPIIVSGALHNFNMYALGGFLGPLIMRYHHADIARAGAYATVVYGLSGIPGLAFGGLLADRLATRWAGGRMLLAAMAFLIAAPCTYAGLTAAPGDLPAFGIPMTLGIAAMYVYYSTTYATIQDLVEPSLRGMAMATYFCAMYLLGAAAGPVALGGLSDHFTRLAAAAGGVTNPTLHDLEPFRGAGLHAAMYVVPALNLALSLCMLVAARLVPYDVTRLQRWMAGSRP